MPQNRVREVEDLGEAIALLNVLEGALIVFRREQVIPLPEPEPFADILERVGVGPADADGFLGEGNHAFALIMKRGFRLNPLDLVRCEVLCEQAAGIEVF